MLMIYFRVIFASKFHMEIFKIFSNWEISPVEYRLQRFRFQRKFGFEKKTDFFICNLYEYYEDHYRFMVDIK